VSEVKRTKPDLVTWMWSVETERNQISRATLGSVLLGMLLGMTCRKTSRDASRNDF
jgi:hypothetical protein